MIVFITGGVRSGKSSYAEELAYSTLKNNDSRLIYIATSKRYDEEINDRIHKHQLDRQNSGHEWLTIEKSTNIENLLSSFNSNDIILLDCLTTLVANELFDSSCRWSDLIHQEDVVNRILLFILTISKRGITLIVVSNELLNGGFQFYDSATLAYMKLIGDLHQRIVKLANKAILVEAGIPLVMKESD